DPAAAASRGTAAEATARKPSSGRSRFTAVVWTTEERMARIEEPRKRPFTIRVLFWIVRRVIGKVPTPWRIKAHRPRLLMAHARGERALQKSHAVADTIKALAQMRTSTLVGCPH
ncbi:MAG TPA: hypothetical protein VL172_17630, partial [Kofleriaceae bacterium]|nr:hypothetical protein [Kofleriaceae bacterium]